MIKSIFNSESYLITEILFIEYTLGNPLKTNLIQNFNIPCTYFNFSVYFVCCRVITQGIKVYIQAVFFAVFMALFAIFLNFLR